LPGEAISPGAFIDFPPAFEGKEGLDLADNFPAAGVGFKDLPEETLKGKAQGEDAVAAPGAVVVLGKQVRGENAVQITLQLGQGGPDDRPG
jgi:hypothetical protein